MATSISTETLKSSTGSQYTRRVETEKGGTIVLDENTGESAVINKHSGTSGGNRPDYDVPAGKKLLGTFHTHPYLSGHIGAIDAIDAQTLIENNVIFKIVQSGPEQFMFLKTRRSHDYKGGMRHLMNLTSELQKKAFTRTRRIRSRLRQMQRLVLWLSCATLLIPREGMGYSKSSFLPLPQG